MAGLLPSMLRLHGENIWEELPRNIFVASVDNFDMLQSYSAVFCGDQQQSYHGTTLHLVQPSSTISLAAPTQNNTARHVYSTHSTASSSNTVCRPVQSTMQMHWLHLHVKCKYNHTERQHPLNQCV